MKLARCFLAVFVLFILAVPVSAQQNPKWYAPLKTKKFWVGEVVMAVMVAADHAVTADLLRKYPRFSDHSWFIGKPPHTAGKIAKAGALSFAIDSGLHVTEVLLVGNDPSPAWRTLGYVGVPAMVTAGSLYGIVHNRNLDAQCRQAKLVC